MTFREWLFGMPDNPSESNQWGALHITTLLFCIVAIIAIYFIFRNKDEKVKRRVILVLASLIAFFELARRLINSYTNTSMTLNSFLYTLLPRPWCAISCWMLMIAIFSNKKFLYNASCYTALLCAVIFFSYPSAGYNNKYIEFSNTYSIVSHMLLLITSVTLITLKFTKFEYKTIKKELITLGIILAYAVFEIVVLKIADDPLYFLPGNDVHEIVGLAYPLYLILYIVFMFIYINAFYIIQDFKNVKIFFKNCTWLDKFRKNRKELETSAVESTTNNKTKSNSKKSNNKKE